MKEKLIRLLLSVLIAFGLWIYVVTVVSPESEATFHNIPVELINESVLQDKGLMVTSMETYSVTVQLRGNRTDLNNLKKTDITATVDLSKINSTHKQPLSVDVTVAGGFVEIAGQSLTSVVVQVAEWTTKKVPVEVNCTGTLGLEYIAYKDPSEIGLDRDFITLTGPKDVIDQITQAVVDVDLTGRVNSITNESYSYRLCDANGQAVDGTGVTPDAETVTLNLKIQRVKEIQLVVNVIYGGGATEENTTIVLDQQTIKVSASDAVLDALGNKLVLGTIRLAEIQDNTTLTYKLNELLPENVDNLSGVTDVTADISFVGLTSKTLTVTQINVIGQPEGMEYKLATKQLTFTVRGPETLINNVSADDITVTVDLTDGTLGDERYKAQFQLGEGFEAVGVIGSHMVLVTLTEAAGGNG